MAIGLLETRMAWVQDALSAAGFATLVWVPLGAVIATLATYINVHRAVIAGLLLEWWVFALGVSLAAHRWAH